MLCVHRLQGREHGSSSLPGWDSCFAGTSARRPPAKALASPVHKAHRWRGGLPRNPLPNSSRGGAGRGFSTSGDGPPRSSTTRIPGEVQGDLIVAADDQQPKSSTPVIPGEATGSVTFSSSLFTLSSGAAGCDHRHDGCAHRQDSPPFQAQPARAGPCGLAGDPGPRSPGAVRTSPSGSRTWVFLASGLGLSLRGDVSPPSPGEGPGRPPYTEYIAGAARKPRRPRRIVFRGPHPPWVHRPARGEGAHARTDAMKTEDPLPDLPGTGRMPSGRHVR